MRPITGDAPPRKSSLTDGRASNTPCGPPTTFFMATEEEVMGASKRESSTDGWPSEGGRKEGGGEGRAGVSKSEDSLYGVQSLEEALGQVFGVDDKQDPHPENSASSGGFVGLLGLKRRKTLTSTDGNDKVLSEDTTDKSPGNPRDLPPRDVHTHNLHSRQSSCAPTISLPLTPLQLESPVPNSAIPSTPKSGSFRSLHLSDEDEGTEDGASQAIASSEDEEGETELDHGKKDMSGSVMPELVMPSLSMPARRPFTARGKQMGRLKVCVAGPAGVGKTSLIRAIFQQCQDIVHIDPIATNSPSAQTTLSSRTSLKGKKLDKSRTTHVTEIHASTKAYPAWWSELEESRILRRRKSMGETVLERNICFIDTPGSSPTWTEEHVVHYIESLLEKNASIAMLSESELMNALSGSGGVQVDVVIYVVPHEWTHDEHITHLGRLSRLTNVIPVFSKVDLISDEEIRSLKRKLVNDLEGNGHRTFSFTRPSEEIYHSGLGQESDTSSNRSPLFRAGPPFAVSCLPASDDHEMDASLLMSPSYSPPLVTSDLGDLVSQLLDPENIAYLRHSAVRKFISWRRQNKTDAGKAEAASVPGRSMMMGHPASSALGIRDQLTLARRTNSSPSPSKSLTHRGRGSHHRRSASPSPTSPFNMSSTSLIGSGLPDFTRARLRDHMFHEERLAEVQMAKWASDLQRSLRTERESFERVAKGERAKWLLERIGEEVVQGNIAALSSAVGTRLPEWPVARRAGGEREKRARGSGTDLELPTWARGTRYAYEEDARDPLGLCMLGDGVTRFGETVIKVLGGGVLVGAVYMAVARAWGLEDKLWGWWGGQ